MIYGSFPEAIDIDCSPSDDVEIDDIDLRNSPEEFLAFSKAGIMFVRGKPKKAEFNLSMTRALLIATFISICFVCALIFLVIAEGEKPFDVNSLVDTSFNDHHSNHNNHNEMMNYNQYADSKYSGEDEQTISQEQVLSNKQQEELPIQVCLEISCFHEVDKCGKSGNDCLDCLHCLFDKNVPSVEINKQLKQEDECFHKIMDKKHQSNEMNNLYECAVKHRCIHSSN